MVINNPAYKKAVQSLWSGRATVTVRVGRLNEATGRTEPVEQVTVKDAACRLSHKTVTTTDPSVKIPAGSKITVTQNGITCDYEQSGKAAVFTYHKEVPLELFREWA